MKAKIVSIQPIKKPKVRFIALTGTPVSELPTNAYSLLRLIQPPLVVSKSKFQSLFIETVEKFFGGQRVTKIKGYRNLDKLAELLSTISIRRTCADVVGMPQKIFTTRYVELSKDQKKLYNDIANRTKSELVGKTNFNLEDVSTITLRLRQILNDPGILGFEVESSKYQALDDIVEEVLEDPMSKIVVWTNYIGGISSLLQRYKEHKAIAVYGPTSEKEIAQYSKTFDRSQNRIVIATPAKAGTGMDWLARARVAVYLDLPFSFTQYLQSQDRLIRRTDINSVDPIEKLKSSPATLIYLHVQKTVDTMVEALLARKASLAQASTAIDIDSLEISRDEMLSFINVLE